MKNLKKDVKLHVMGICMNHFYHSRFFLYHSSVICAPTPIPTNKFYLGIVFIPGGAHSPLDKTVLPKFGGQTRCIMARKK